MWKKLWLFMALLLLYANAEAAVRTTLQSAATATGNGTNMTVDDKGAAGVTITGTFVGTITFEGSADGALTFSAVTCTEIASLVSSTTTTTTGQYQCPVAGLSHFRARISAFTSGSITAIGTASNGSIGSAGAGAGGSIPTFSGCWATAAAPTYLEGILNGLSCTLAGALRVTLETLLAGEDLVNNLLMTSGGAVRQSVLFSGVTTNTTTTAFTLPVGSKSISAKVSGTGSVTAIIQYFCDDDNDAANGDPVGTITLSGTTLAHDRLPPITASCAFIYATTTNVTGTGATVSSNGNY